MAVLDRLSPSGQIAGPNGAPTSWFLNLWQRTMTAIEQRFTDIQDLVTGVTEFSSINIGGVTVTTLGNSATRNVGTTAGTVATGNDSRITGAAQKASNLSDLASAATARTNLGLGNAATRAVGTTAGTVAVGDDARFTYARPTYATVATDAGFTITPTASVSFVLHTGTLTADRVVAATSAQAGDSIQLARTGAGAFNLIFAGKSLATNTWGVAVYDGSGWYLASYGAL